MNDIARTQATLSKALTISLMLAVLPLSVFSQIDQKKVDSLKSALAGSTEQNTYNILDELAYEFVWRVDTIALPYATEAFKMSWNFGDSARIVKSGRTKAMALNGLEKYDSTVALVSRILPVAKRNNNLEETKRLLNLAALAYVHSAQYDKALSYNFESLDLRKKYGDSLSVSIALNNIGFVYFKIEDWEHAADYFEKASKLGSLQGQRMPNVDNNYYVGSLANLGICYAYMNDLIRAGYYIQKAYTQCEQGCADEMLIRLHFGSGLILYRQDHLEAASTQFLKSLVIARKLSNRRSELDNLIVLAEISLKSNQVTRAEKYLLQAGPLFETDIPLRAEIAEVYAHLGEVYTRLGKPRKAGYFQAKYIDISKKIHSMQLTANLMKIHAEYQERENKAKIDTQEKILALNNDVIYRQRALNIIAGFVAVLLVALVIALIQNVKQKRRANQLLEQRVKERTLELEINQNALMKSLEERNLQMKRVSYEVNSSVATIRGLCQLSAQDINVINAGQYIDKIEKASHTLQSDVFRTLGINQNGN